MAAICDFPPEAAIQEPTPLRTFILIGILGMSM
jgi:hypothetical protein